MTNNQAELSLASILDPFNQFTMFSNVLSRTISDPALGGDWSDAVLFSYIYNWYKTKKMQQEVDTAGYFMIPREQIIKDIGGTDGIIRRHTKRLIELNLIDTHRESKTSVTKFRINFVGIDRLLRDADKISVKPSKKKISKDQFYVGLTAHAKQWDELRVHKDNLKLHQIQVLYTISRLAGSNPVEWAPSTVGLLNTKLKEFNVTKKPIDYGSVRSITIPRYVTSQTTAIKYTQLLICSFFDHLAAYPERHPSSRESFESIFTEI